MELTASLCRIAGIMRSIISSQRSVLIEDESVLAFQTFIQFHGESVDRKVALTGFLGSCQAGKNL